MDKVCWIFRSKKRKEHSIENVFGNMEKHIVEQFDIENDYLPEERYFSLKKMIANANYVKTLSGDIYHITGEVNFIALFTPKEKTVITIHDYILLYRYKGLRKFGYGLLFCYLPFKRAKYLTCISPSTYEDTIKRFPWCKDKTVLIEDPISDDFTFNEKKFNRENPVILLIGANPNKNFERVSEALSGIRCKVDIIGKLSDEQKYLIQKYNLDAMVSSNITDEEMVRHYRDSDILVFASMYEGFGMPIIEAQATGRCVVTSNIEPMKTVSGEGAILVDPYSVESIRNGIQKVIDSEKLRENLIIKGEENSKKYRASNISEEYLNLYRKMRKE